MLRVGVIGTGRMGQYHANLLSGMAGVAFSGIAELDAGLGATVGQRHGVAVFSDFRELLPHVDAVTIAVPTWLHYRVALACLEAGVHVLLEKPITRTVRRAEELVSLAARRGLVLQVGHVERFNGAIRQIGNIVAHPYLVEARRLSPYDPRVRDIGVVLDLMIHDIDIVLSLLGPGFDRVEAVGAVRHGRHEDLVNAQLLHEGGCVVSIIASRVTPQKIRTLAVSQEDAYISLDYSTQEILIHRRARPDYQVRPDHEIRYSVESLVERVFIHNTNPLEQELRHFLDCVRGATRPLVDGSADVETLRIASRILECVRRRA